MMMNASINQAEVFIGTIFDIHENDILNSPMIGDKVIVAQSNPNVDVNKVPFEFKKLSDKNGKYVVTDTRNIIARLCASFIPTLFYCIYSISINRTGIIDPSI